MAWRRRKRRPTRAELIERKHQLEGQINVLASEVKRRQRQGDSAGEMQARLNRLWSRHYQTRLEIDRTDPEA